MQTQEEDRIVQAYKQCLRTAMMRILAIGPTVFQVEELDSMFSKLLHGNWIKEAAIIELTNAQIKNDQHYFILLSLMHDLCQWCIDSEEIRRSLRINSDIINLSIIELILSRSLKLLNFQKKHYTLVSRQNELIRILMQLFQFYSPFFVLLHSGGEIPNNPSEASEETFMKLYNMLKDSKQYHPANIRQEQKRTFLKSIEETLKSIEKIITEAKNSGDEKYYSIVLKHSRRTVQLLYEESSKEIYQNLKSNDPAGNQVLLSRLKIVKSILEILNSLKGKVNFNPNHSLQEESQVRYNTKILHGVAHLLIESSNHKLLFNLYQVGLIFSIYEELMQLLLQKETMVPLYLYTNVVINNLKRMMGEFEEKTPFLTQTTSITANVYENIAGRNIILETILSQMSELFSHKFLAYFLKLYDWNFMEEDICLETLKILYEFIEDRGNEKKPEYEIYKNHLGLINKGIQKFLQDYEKKNNELNKIGFLKERKQFYELKKKQYFDIVDRINEKPKDIFKAIDAFKEDNEDAKEQYIQKCIRILHKSKHVDPKAMINIVSSRDKISEVLLEKYLDSLMKSANNISLEEFIRFMISNFFLSGEAQQIERVLDKLTVYFYNHNPKSASIFKNSNVVYTFANAIVILNTDQHNPKNQHKMNEEAFLKMCKKINDSEDLPEDIVKKTFRNIRQSQIYTYRDRYKMGGISLENWMVLVGDEANVSIGYYDADMAEMEKAEIMTKQDAQNEESVNSNNTINGFAAYAYELLMAVIDEKETQKLQILVERFEYDEKKFDCEIIDKIREMIPSKPHMAMHVLQKVYEEAQFNTKKKMDDKMLSYYWLASNIILNFNQLIPFSKITEFLLITWRVRFELNDTLHIREISELRKMKKILREHKKKENKKSIMDIFSKFLGSKEEEHDEEEMSPANHSPHRRRTNLLNYSSEILNILMKNQEGRAKAAESILLGIQHEQAKRFEEFIACLYLIFYLTNGERGTTRNDCAEICTALLSEIFGLVSTKIYLRIENLKIKSDQKYEELVGMCQIWGLKVIINWKIRVSRDSDNQSLINEKLAHKADNILERCIQILKKVNKQTLKQILSVVEECQGCSYELLTKQIHLSQSLLKALKQSADGNECQCEYLMNKEQTKKEENVSIEKGKTQNSQQKSPQVQVQQDGRNKIEQKSEEVQGHQKDNSPEFATINEQNSKKGQKSEKEEEKLDESKIKNEEFEDDIEYQMKKELGILDEAEELRRREAKIKRSESRQSKEERQKPSQTIENKSETPTEQQPTEPNDIIFLVQ